MASSSPEPFGPAEEFASLIGAALGAEPDTDCSAEPVRQLTNADIEGFWLAGMRVLATPDLPLLARQRVRDAVMAVDALYPRSTESPQRTRP